MATRRGYRDARAHFAAALDAACVGKRQIITRHGEDIAALVSVADLERLERLDRRNKRRRERLNEVNHHG